MADSIFGYSYKLEKQTNGWWLIRFPAIPEALTEGETKAAAIEAAKNCLATTLEGYLKSGRPIPHPQSHGRAGAG